jgi:hypothetical protein
MQVRVPVPIKAQVQDLIDNYRTTVLTDYKPVNKFREIANAIASDPRITRNGKDSGAVKRTLQAFLSQLEN